MLFCALSCVGLLSTISYCSDLIQRREETMKKRLEREIERRRKAEKSASTRRAAEPAVTRIIGGPDFEEGPYCAMKEDDFLDAIENECDRLEQEEEDAEVCTHRQVNRREGSRRRPVFSASSFMSKLCHW